MDQINPLLTDKPVLEFDQISADLLALVTALYGAYPYPVNIASALGSQSDPEVVVRALRMMTSEGIVSGPDDAMFLTANGHTSIGQALSHGSDTGRGPDSDDTYSEAVDPSHTMLRFMQAHFRGRTKD